ncbi:hypothetical protein [Ruminiclostridium cellulolyticum]|uniref:Uncharacterized protein n=1 Tax=Ruminiclostridium cellulolyticum (strain ATCC 35319 / DSM 5812 / JCM 6584 / H10) TaxID=394503 RepID=B8I349_RUMCH|nr:hypothetical protein [Ruminiclostridium cellulolyticum]ACL76192.1 hypothetical protein Ccel_1844 [Ruminiclostridium cellulolyticum H10]
MSILTKSEADRTIKRLQAVFTFHNFGDDGVKVEWMKSIGTLDFKKCDKLIDQYKKADSKSLPPISLFLQEYWKYENRNKEIISCSCPKCNARGYLTYRHQYEYKDEQLLSQPFVAHCDCAAGEQFTYNGTQISDHKSEYYVPSASELNLVEEKTPIVSGVDEIKRQVYRLLGKSLNIQPRISFREQRGRPF